MSIVVSVLFCAGLENGFKVLRLKNILKTSKVQILGF